MGRKMGSLLEKWLLAGGQDRVGVMATGHRGQQRRSTDTHWEFRPRWKPQRETGRHSHSLTPEL